MCYKVEGRRVELEMVKLEGRDRGEEEARRKSTKTNNK